MSSITFANPVLGFLALGLVALALVSLRFLSQKKLFRSSSLGYSQTSLAKTALRQALGYSPKNTTPLLLILRIAALATFALALARPQKITTNEMEPILGVDVMLVIDTSASMQALDFQPFNRIQAAKKIASEFVAKRRGDRIGLVAFGGAAVIACPPTLDHDAVQGFLNHIEIGMTQTDGTAIGSGLMTALNHLKKFPSKSKTVILLTDGRNNAGSVDPITAAKTAQALGVKVYAIGTGKRGGGIFPIQDPYLGTRYVRVPEEEIDEETLTKIADLTQGQYFRATELAELRAIFEQIDLLEKTEIVPPKIARYEELYPLLVTVGIFLLGLEVFLRGTLMFTLP